MIILFDDILSEAGILKSGKADELLDHIKLSSVCSSLIRITIRFGTS